MPRARHRISSRLMKCTWHQDGVINPRLTYRGVRDVQLDSDVAPGSERFKQGVSTTLDRRVTPARASRLTMKG
ncbi:MAG: hypothetical protein OEV22_15015 [Deltaproteobacteria bacterium]|nr:hypothetical protein [Deltaproteobacteria bacterium]